MNSYQENLSVEGVAVSFNRLGGNISDFVITHDNGQSLRPLHVAPWVENAENLPDSIPLVERQLAGDFFCAPFGASPDLPIHGWTANGLWESGELDSDADGTLHARYTLRERVHGAQVSKLLSIRPGHPCLYQRHVFDGGEGHLPIAHRAMIHVPGGATLSFSERQYGVTPLQAPESLPEKGRSILSYPQRFDSLQTLQSADGATVDASRYPFASTHEDIAILAGSKDDTLGWTAALASADGFLFFALKDARVLPETVLWMSNGGRYYAPWSSRHEAVLGIEEAATSCHANQEFGSQSGLSQAGLVMGLSLAPGQTQTVRYCFGAIPAPTGWTTVTDMRIENGLLVLQDAGGESVSVPFDEQFFRPD